MKNKHLKIFLRTVFGMSIVFCFSILIVIGCYYISSVFSLFIGIGSLLVIVIIFLAIWSTLLSWNDDQNE